MTADPDLAAARTAVSMVLGRLPHWELMPVARLDHAGCWIAVARDRRGGRGSVEAIGPTQAAALRGLAALLEERAAGR